MLLPAGCLSRKDFKIYMTKLLRSSAALDTVREGLLACLGMLTGDIARCVPVVVPVAGPIKSNYCTRLTHRKTKTRHARTLVRFVMKIIFSMKSQGKRLALRARAPHFDCTCCPGSCVSVVCLLCASRFACILRACCCGCCVPYFVVLVHFRQ